MYYFGRLISIHDLDSKKDSIAIFNLKQYDTEYMVVCENSWKSSMPFLKEDHLIDSNGNVVFTKQS
jgi:hypothetical protein